MKEDTMSENKLTKKEAFEQLIKPLIEAARAHCKEHDIPALFDFLVGRDGDKSHHMMLSVSGSETMPDSAQLEALLVLEEGSIAAAMAALVLQTAIVGGDESDADPIARAIASALGGRVIAAVKIPSKKKDKDGIEQKPINEGNPY
jgi:hypothetical protein